jgi:hypothetical protein
MHRKMMSTRKKETSKERVNETDNRFLAYKHDAKRMGAGLSWRRETQMIFVRSKMFSVNKRGYLNTF